MTVALILPDRIVSDSRQSGEPPTTVGKIFRRPDGALFTTAGDSRLTYAFERAMSQGIDPDYPEPKDGENFEAAVLRVDGSIVTYDLNFAPSIIAETWTAIGSGWDIASSWWIHARELGLTPEDCIARACEVREDCGGPVVTVLLHPTKIKVKNARQRKNAGR